METMAGFILRSSVYLMVFALAYKVMFSRKVHPTFNRFYLLMSMVITLFLSLISGIAIEVEHEVQESAVMTLPEIIIRAQTNYTHTSNLFSSSLAAAGSLLWIAPAVSVAMLLLLILQSIRLFVIAFRYQNPSRGGLTFVPLPEKNRPFSFFHWFFFPAPLMFNSNFDKVLAHEMAHFRRYHSADVLFFELLRVIFWFHPAYYYLRHELKAMHEFEADSLALTQFARTEYQTSLLELQLGGTLIPLTNPFNVSLIKKRMLMMNRQKWQKPARNWFKMIGLIPVMLILVFVLSCETSPKEKETAVAAVSEKDVPESAVAQKTETVEEDEVFMVVETMPEYPGGTEAMIKFLSENIRYPEEAKNKNVQGQVFVNFIIEKDGKVGQVKIARGIGSGCDEEALRVVRMMPNWKPGEQRGEKVRVSFNLPIRFALS